MQAYECILIIDDDPLTSLLHKFIIQDMECAKHIIIKNSAQAGLTYLVNSTYSALPFPDIILLDHEMPIADGWIFLEKFKIIKELLLDVPKIIMVSPFIDDNLFDPSDFENITAFCGKPMTLEMIRPLIF